MSDAPGDAVITESQQIDLPDWIYQIYVDAANATDADWVRVVISQDREKGQSGGLMFSAIPRVMIWDGAAVTKDNLETDAQITWRIDDYLEEQIPGPWTRAVIIIDATGDRSCTLYLVQRRQSSAHRRLHPNPRPHPEPRE